jgi:hypothetical protein
MCFSGLCLRCAVIAQVGSAAQTVLLRRLRWLAQQHARCAHMPRRASPCLHRFLLDGFRFAVLFCGSSPGSAWLVGRMLRAYALVFPCLPAA